jgi:hypothetical protein
MFCDDYDSWSAADLDEGIRDLREQVAKRTITVEGAIRLEKMRAARDIIRRAARYPRGGLW